MRLVAYTRVSTDEQAREGSSLDAQLHAIEQWCAAMGHELVYVYREEGVSGSTLERPELTMALAQVFGVNLQRFDVADADGLIVLKLDRLTRSVRDFCTLVERFDKAGKALVSVRDSLDTTTASGRLVANILVSVSQWEREAISERTKDALAQKRREGVRLGRPLKQVPDDVAEQVRWKKRHHNLTNAQLSEMFGIGPKVVARLLR